jgi:hypothetical protein
VCGVLWLVSQGEGSSRVPFWARRDPSRLELCGGVFYVKGLFFGVLVQLFEFFGAKVFGFWCRSIEFCGGCGLCLKFWDFLLKLMLKNWPVLWGNFDTRQSFIFNFCSFSFLLLIQDLAYQMQAYSQYF